MRSQIATASKRNIRHRPKAFTEHGAIMAATVLNSPEAIAMSVFVVRAFMLMREQLAANTISGTGMALDLVHFANFIDTIRLGTPVNCPAAEGHVSVALLHLGNISWRVGREVYCDTTNGHILHNHDAMKL